MILNRLTGRIRRIWFIGQPERATQNRVVALFRHELHYRYLGDWRDRDDNSNIKDPGRSPEDPQCIPLASTLPSLLIAAYTSPLSSR
jgi:hypothetical protein